MKTKLKGEAMLLLTALIWGTAFAAQRFGMDYIGPFTFNGVRCMIGALVLLPVILLFQRAKKTQSGQALKETQSGASEKKTLLVGGLACGVVFFLSSSVQQTAMLYTTAGKAGFITALYIVIVPILGIFLKQRVRPLLWVCVALATAGLYLLSIKDDFTIGKGDLLVILCAFGFSVHILLIDHFSPKTDGVKLSAVQFLVCAVLSLPFMLAFETIRIQALLDCWFPLFYTGVMSCGVAYTLQIIAQKYTEPTVASLLLSLESVFAVLAGILILHEQISTRELAGCIIMFVAILLAQRKEKQKKGYAARLKPY